MKCMVLHDWVKTWGNNLKLEEREIPEPGPGEALVRVRACGVGLTVSNFLIGEFTRDEKMLPRIPGHEIAGEIAELGPDTLGFSRGDRVLVYFYLHCNRCTFCFQGLQPLCLNFGGFVGVQIDGGYAEYIKVPVNNLLPLPEGLSFKDATVINDAVATPVHVMRQRAEAKPNDDIMIIGAGGGVGIHAVQVAKIFGARVIGVDIDDGKLESVRQYGAEWVINAKTKSLGTEAKRLTGGKGVEAVVDFVGSKETLTQGYQSLARRGRLINMTIHPDVTLEISPRNLVNEEVVVTGSRYTTKLEFTMASEFVRSGKVKPVISNSTGFEGVEALHEALSGNRMLGRGVLLPP
ncbi:MAG: alcohol dehydrogenase catalytic domain-containing protein [Nitrososphaerales archaeon]